MVDYDKLTREVLSGWTAKLMGSKPPTGYEQGGMAIPFQETWVEQRDRTAGIPQAIQRPGVVSYDSLRNSQMQQPRRDVISYDSLHNDQQKKMGIPSPSANQQPFQETWVEQRDRTTLTPSVGMPKQQGFDQGGSPGGTPDGIIPGPVEPGAGDNTMTPTQTGEYITPVDAIIAKGRELAPKIQLSDEDAHNLGKMWFDQETTRLKQMAGNPNPPRNAGIPLSAPKAGGYAEGGGILGLDKMGPSGLSKMSDGSLPPTTAPATTTTAPVNTAPVTPAVTPTPAEPKVSFGLPSTTQLKVSAGNTATGPEKAVNLTNAGIDRYAGMKDNRGVTADLPNNLPDLANSVRSIQETSNGNDINKGSDSNPSITMRGSLDPATAKTIHDRVDWSPGSANDIAVAADAREKEARRKDAILNGPKTEAQILQGLQSGNTTWDMPPEQQVALAKRQFESQEELRGKQMGIDATKEITKAEMDIKRQGLDIQRQGLGIKQQDADTRAKNINSQAEYRKNIAAAKKKVGTGELSGLDPKTIQDLAAEYAQTGKMPPLGMGAKAAADREVILGAWSNMIHNTGDSVQDQVLRRSALKASQGELNKLQAQRGQIMAFAKNAAKEFDMVEKLSGEVGRSGSPLINRWIVAGKKATGDPDAAKFHAVVQTAVSEYAKVMSSATGTGVTSDSARKEAQEMLNTAQTPEQVKGVLKILRQGIENRRTSYDDQINGIKSAISGQPVQTPGIPQQQPGQDIGQPANELAPAISYLKTYSGQYSQDQMLQALKKQGWSEAQIGAAYHATRSGQ
jgi:hypothetical protein